MKKITVLIVDDSALIRQMFTTMLSKDPAIEVVGSAVDPYDAREKIKKLNPDVITLDVEMPKMDGLAFLEKIMSLRPMPVVMVSSLTQRGADVTLKAMEIGAVDYISKPTENLGVETIALLQDKLISKVKMAARANVRPKGARYIPEKPQVLEYKGNADKIIAIGSSTGGVEALREIVGVLPANTPPIVVTQHMPEAFTASFAKRLDENSEMTVYEAQDGMKIERGCLYLAHGGQHLEIKKQGTGYVCYCYKGENVSGHCPSVDVLFRSVAKEAKNKALGVILTGMGKDGADGMLEMKNAGIVNLGQDEASCVVYGMPKVAYDMGAVSKQVSLERMAKEILQHA